MGITKEALKAHIELAMTHLYTNEEEFMKVVAMEFTIANLGRSLEETRMVRVTDNPANLVSLCYNQVDSDYGMEGVEIEPERKSWLKDAKKIVATLKKHGMSFTLINAHDVAENASKYSKVAKKR